MPLAKSERAVIVAPVTGLVVVEPLSGFEAPQGPRSLGPNLKGGKSHFMNCNCQNDDDPNNDRSHERPRCKVVEASDFVSSVTGSHDIGWLNQQWAQASPKQIFPHIALGSYTFGRDLPINIRVSTTRVKSTKCSLSRGSPTALLLVLVKKTATSLGNGTYRIVASQHTC
jgi:hypothetical protein